MNTVMNYMPNSLNGKRKAYIESVLQSTDFDVSKTAVLLGITMKELYGWLNRLNISIETNVRKLDKVSNGV